MQKHQASKCDFPGRNTAAFILHMHHLQTISAHTSTVRWACSVLTLPLTNSGSISPSRRHQATTHAVQGSVGLPHAQQPHSELIQKSRRIKKKSKLHPEKKKPSQLEKATYYGNLSPAQKFYLERFLLLNPLLRAFLVENPSQLSRYKFSYTPGMFYLTEIFL